MFSAHAQYLDPTTAALARSEGCLRLSLKRRGALTVIDRLFQSGCLKARFAAPDLRHANDPVLINTAGGLTGGDMLDITIRWGAKTRSTITTQAAEKIYRSAGGVARVTTTLDLKAGACGEWLPQETIFFDRAALDRDIAVRLAGDASFLGLEAIVLGRRAMGESLAEGQWRDAWRIWRDGKLFYADVLKMEGALAASLRRAAVAQGAIAFATLLAVGPDAAARCKAIRDALGEDEGCAASAWNGLLAVRFAVRDGAVLRRLLVQALAILRPARPMPAPWQI